MERRRSLRQRRATRTRDGKNARRARWRQRHSNSAEEVSRRAIRYVAPSAHGDEAAMPLARHETSMEGALIFVRSLRAAFAAGEKALAVECCARRPVLPADGDAPLRASTRRADTPP